MTSRFNRIKNFNKLIQKSFDYNCATNLIPMIVSNAKITTNKDQNMTEPVRKDVMTRGLPTLYHCHSVPT